MQEISIVHDSTSLGRCPFQRDNAGDGDVRPDISELQRDLPQLRDRARDLVLANWYPIHKLAEALRAKPVLTGEEAEAVLDAAWRELVSHVPATPVPPGGSTAEEQASSAHGVHSIDEQGVAYASSTGVA